MIILILLAVLTLAAVGAGLFSRCPSSRPS